MKCRDCKCAKRGYFKSVPYAHVCIGVKEPFVIEDYPMCRKTPCFSYGDIRHFHRIYSILAKPTHTHLGAG